MALYKNNDFKFSVIINKKIDSPTIMNAVAHAVAGLISLEKQGEYKFLEYVDGSNSKHPAISEYPFIILGAKNSNQLRNTRKAAIELGLVYNDFTDSMLGESCEKQLQQTRNKLEEGLEYYVLVMFGKSDDINSLTKKFSLFR